MSTLTQNETATAPAAEQSWLAPDVNIFESKTGYVLEADLPGVSKAGLSVTVEDNELTVTGKRATPAPQGTALHAEIRAHDYRRTFRLDPAIDVAKISAKLDQGVLTLTLPKSEKALPRTVQVN